MFRIMEIVAIAVLMLVIMFLTYLAIPQGPAALLGLAGVLTAAADLAESMTRSRHCRRRVRPFRTAR